MAKLQKDLEKIGERLKEIRITEGKTQIEVSSEIEESQGNYSRYEKGKNPPSEKLIHYLISKQWSYRWIMYGEGEKKEISSYKELISQIEKLNKNFEKYFKAEKV